MLFYFVLATTRSMTRVSTGRMLLVPVTLSWIAPQAHSHVGSIRHQWQIVVWRPVLWQRKLGHGASMPQV